VDFEQMPEKNEDNIKLENQEYYECPYCTVNLIEEKKSERRIPLIIITISAIILALGLYVGFIGDQQLISQILFLAVAFISGYETIKYGILSILKGRFTISILITIAAVGAFTIGQGAEGASVLFLYYIAEFLEDYASERARNSIGELVKLTPETALVKMDEKNIEMHAHAVKVDEIVVVKPGDKIPLDGIVTKGISSVNQAAITGESFAATKSVGDEVYAGTINEEGYLEVKVTKRSNETVLSKIIELVKDSQKRKSNTEAFIDRFAGYYTPMVIVLAMIVAIVPPFIWGLSFDTWFYRALVLLVVSCPCALAISTPVAMVSGITSGTRNGVLIKGGEYVEEMQNTKIMVFDKTGTLTEGKLEVTDIIPLNNYSKDEILQIAASLESNSKHPLAEALLRYFEESELKFNDVKDFESLPGKGLKGKIGDKIFYIGTKSLFNENIKFPDDLIKDFEIQGKTTIIISEQEYIIGLIGLMDTIKDHSKSTIKELNKRKIKTVMLTGDNEGTAKAVATELGIDEYYANLLPENKVKVVDELLAKYKHVVMVGDGVNDAPALARSTVGVAMGAAGSDVAIESADISLMHDDISKVNYLIDLSKKTMGVVKENVSVSIIVKTSFAILAVFGLVTLWMAVAFGDMGLSLLVILNSIRIGRNQI
jgi:Cd2+/Zn2+-exporting ATPase